MSDLVEVWWFSSNGTKRTGPITVAVAAFSRGCEEPEILRGQTPPIARRFEGQPIGNLVDWMRGHGGFRAEFLHSCAPWALDDNFLPSGAQIVNEEWWVRHVIGPQHAPSRP